MANSVAKGRVIPLADVIPVEEAEKAAEKVQEAVAQQRKQLGELERFCDENNALSKLVMELPDAVSHSIMVPFGKAAFFPGRLIHTNEFLVLLGEGYYSERSARQTVDILDRRHQYLESKIDDAKAQISDLEAELSFATNAAAEAKAGLVEIREDYEENSEPLRWGVPASSSSATDSDISSNVQAGSSHATSTTGRTSSVKDTEHERIMARLSQLELAEAAAAEMSDEDSGEGEEDDDDDDDNDIAEAVTQFCSGSTNPAPSSKKKDKVDDEDSDCNDSREDNWNALDSKDDDVNRSLRNHPNERSLNEQSDQSQITRVDQVRGLEGSRILSRFARETMSVKEAVDSQYAQQKVTLQTQELLEKISPVAAGGDPFGSGLEQIEEWRRKKSNNQGYVLGEKEAQKDVGGSTTYKQQKGLKSIQPPAGVQAFTGTVTERGSGPVAMRSSAPVVTPTERVIEAQPSRPISKFKMRQAGR